MAWRDFNRPPWGWWGDAGGISVRRRGLADRHAGISGEDQVLTKMAWRYNNSMPSGVLMCDIP